MKNLFQTKKISVTFFLETSYDKLFQCQILIQEITQIIQKPKFHAGRKKKYNLLNSNNYLHVKSAAKQHLGRSLQ